MKINRLLTLTFLALGIVTTQAQKSKKTQDVWAQGEAVANAIVVPTFAEKTFNICDYGANINADALTNKNAINKAIEECNCAGGGKVIVPYGVWLTGPITMLSNVNLVIEKGAILKFSTDRNLYLPVVRTRWEGIDCYNLQPLIYANNQKNIALTGEGTVDGNATIETWWHSCGAKKWGWKEGQISQSAPGHGRVALSEFEQNKVDVEKRKMTIADGLRPQLVNFYQCENILIENVTLRNSPFWVIHPVEVNNMTVRGVTIISHGPNGDGCDPESSKNVLIENCFFDTGDDCIAIKSGRNNDARRHNIPSENIIVRNCKMKNGHGGVVIGSEIGAGYKNLWVENCDMDSPELDRVIRIKTNPCRGGIIENIYVRNIRVGQCREAVLKINLDYEARENCKRDYPPFVRNVFMENVVSQKSKLGIFIIGLKESCNIENIQITDCQFNGVEKGDDISGMTSNIVYKNYKRNGETIKTIETKK